MTIRAFLTGTGPSAPSRIGVVLAASAAALGAAALYNTYHTHRSSGGTRQPDASSMSTVSGCTTSSRARERRSC
jgi:hypothetical protein